MALGKTQAVILQALAASPLKERFYWTGGTLLAEKYLHHRHSYDVDLFTGQPFRYEEVYRIIQAVKEKEKLTKVEQKKVFDRWEFFIHNHSEVRCEFVLYDAPPLQPREKWRGVLIDSLFDLAANKTMAAVDRHEPKDAVDIYFLMVKKKMTAQTLLRLAKKKFGVQWSESLLLGQLLLASRLLSDVKPLLFGNAREQDTHIKTIQDHFTRLSADFVRRELNG